MMDARDILVVSLDMLTYAAPAIFLFTVIGLADLIIDFLKGLYRDKRARRW